MGKVCSPGRPCGCPDVASHRFESEIRCGPGFVRHARLREHLQVSFYLSGFFLYVVRFGWGRTQPNCFWSSSAGSRTEIPHGTWFCSLNSVFSRTDFGLAELIWEQFGHQPNWPHTKKAASYQSSGGSRATPQQAATTSPAASEGPSTAW